MMKFEEKARELRGNIISSLESAGSGHPGGSLSAIDILTVLYYKEMDISLENYDSQDRDHFILSKGHAAPALYAVLADKGFFDKKELLNLRKFSSMLQGHPDRLKTRGVDSSSGSLGQGLSIANGLALAKRQDNIDKKVYVLLGDGELQEGQVWEAAMTAAHYKLNNVIALVDHNGLQIDGSNDEVMAVNNIADKFKAFNWHVLEANGHDITSLIEAIEQAKTNKGAPTMILCETIKGKGVSFMENQVGWHGKAPSPEEAQRALSELKEVL
ncbi:transketolase [Vagococcus xieshaowenii]|uniref:Transketolase n=1 Tax=Vagococcus xieshaowenii TaxID=2562451 RepID=A0A4Z0D9G5_9ENTE|nr:transketolase [Vagococcus xieshaowenii]QCA29418.1 transketolase [Vagococcus xieshaowenii]TFZ41539.1 transketolase [Vagococcus xieshaowenii]